MFLHGVDCLEVECSSHDSPLDTSFTLGVYDATVFGL